MHLVSCTLDIHGFMKSCVKIIKLNSVNFSHKTSVTFCLAFSLLLMQQDNQMNRYEIYVTKMIITDFSEINICLETCLKGG